MPSPQPARHLSHYRHRLCDGSISLRKRNLLLFSASVFLLNITGHWSRSRILSSICLFLPTTGDSLGVVKKFTVGELRGGVSTLAGDLRGLSTLVRLFQICTVPHWSEERVTTRYERDHHCMTGRKDLAQASQLL